MKITLPRSEYEKLLAHARANLPEERSLRPDRRNAG